MLFVASHGQPRKQRQTGKLQPLCFQGQVWIPEHDYEACMRETSRDNGFSAITLASSGPDPPLAPLCPTLQTGGAVPAGRPPSEEVKAGKGDSTKQFGQVRTTDLSPRFTLGCGS